MSEKKLLRRASRKSFPGEMIRNEESRSLCEWILKSECYQQASIVAGYIPLRWEADVWPVLMDCLQAGKTLVLPRIEPDGRMTMRRVVSLDALTEGKYHIPEPAEQTPVIDPGKLELILVPLEALDRHGMRLGKGGGFYDRLLTECNATAMGIVMSWQWIDTVPADPWDKKLNCAADKNGITWF